VQEREDSESAASGPCFKEIFLDSDQRLSYLWCKISFCNFSHLSTNYTVHNMQEWEDSGSAASGPCFKEIFLDSDQRLSYLWCKISFCNFSHLSTNYTVHSWKHVQKWTFWSSECSICFHLGWFVRLVLDVINPNSENITEVQ